MVETNALLGAVAKLIGVGVAVWKARAEDGLHLEEIEALQEALATLSELGAVFGKDVAEQALIRQHCELLTVAFGEAWRRHWHHDAALAPTRMQSHWTDVFRPRALRRRIAQLEESLRDAQLELALTGGPPSELNGLGQLCDNPLLSPWYRVLWEAFRAQSDPASPTPLLLLEQGGADKHRFERSVLAAFREGLMSERSRALREWLLSKEEERLRRVRELLAARQAGFRNESIFPSPVSGLPILPLERMYVEPFATRLVFSAGAPPRGDPAGPIVEALEAALARPEARIILVLADFGRGKSLTARTMAYRQAERFLQNTEWPSPEVDYPIFVRCHESLSVRLLDAEATVRRAQKRLAEPFAGAADERDPAFQMPCKDQRSLILLDGLDEVQLTERETVEVFSSLSGHANQRRRFIVFSRPSSVPAEVCQLQEVIVFRLEDFQIEPGVAGHPSQVARWLEAWRSLTPEPHPSVDELEQHGLLPLSRVPVLLFMVAHSWERVRSLTLLGRIDVYEQFLQLTVRSKLQYEQQHHPVIAQAAKKLQNQLIAQGRLNREVTIEAALLDVLGRIAWRAHCSEEDGAARPLTTHDLVTILRELNVDAAEIDSIYRGVVLTFQTSLTDAAQELHFVHKSFREFLVAKFWAARLHTVLDLKHRQREPLEQELMQGRLLVGSDQSFAFLLELCARWPAEQRTALVHWAEEAFNDELLNGKSLREDRRAALREAALAIGSGVSPNGLMAESRFTLASLIAGAWVTARRVRVLAPRLRHPQAWLFRADLRRSTLSGADLSGADLGGADLSNADLTNADLSGANLTLANLTCARLTGAKLRGSRISRADLDEAALGSADLSNADLSGANLSYACLNRANLSGAILDGANLLHAALRDAQLRDTRLNGVELFYADLRGAKLVGADLCGADLSDSNITGTCFSGARCNGRTRFPPDFDADANGVTFARSRPDLAADRPEPK